MPKVQNPDGTIKKRKVKPKPERPPIVLVTPKPLYRLDQVTDLELFRAMIDDKPRVAMKVGNSFVLWDGVGHPSRVDLPLRDIQVSFIDYLTEEEGVYIPGSAEERIEPVAEPVTESAEGRIDPIDPLDFSLIPNGQTYIFQHRSMRDYYTYHARNFNTGKGKRVALLFGINTGNESWSDLTPQEGWAWAGWVDEHDEARWLTHGLRKTHGVIDD